MSNNNQDRSNLIRHGCSGILRYIKALRSLSEFKKQPVTLWAMLLKRPMCGRFTNRLTWREIVAQYRLTIPATPERNLPARYNICPTTTIDAVIEREGKRELVPMRWGLVPSWWKKTAKETPSTFNARAETVAEKPMFRSAFKRSRCLIPASGYYEWQNTPTGKQPYYYTARDDSPLTIAGLWDEWKDIETGELLKSCTMIIANANDLASKIHDRMPGSSPGARELFTRLGMHSAKRRLIGAAFQFIGSIS
jgi:putative SOS response-associated peptidase YedK